MTDDLWDKFGARFRDGARRRIQVVRSLQAHGAWNNASEIVDQLHALAGEAEVIGQHAFGEVAREAERIARDLMSSDESTLHASLDRVLADLERRASDLR